MKFAIFGNPGGWHFEQLSGAAHAKGHDTADFDLREATVNLNHGETPEYFCGSHSVRDVDCLLTRAMPVGSLQQIVFRMDWLFNVQHVLSKPVINSAKCIEAAVDKYLCLERIREKGVRVPTTSVSQTVELAMLQFEQLGGDVVVKPIFGSRGRGLARLSDKSAAMQHFETLVDAGDVIYQQQFLPHDSDLRLLVIGDEIYSMSRHKAGHWITNASQGATCKFHQPTSEETSMAMEAALAVGADIAGVDIVYENDVPYVLEVNSSPAWRALGSVVEANIAERIISFAEKVAS